MNAVDRLKRLEDRLGLGPCRRCEEFARSGFRVRMDGGDASATDADRTCPECGHVEPPPSFTIVVQTREDGPQ